MPEARVVQATWLSKDRKVILVAVGPDNCERYRVKCEEPEVTRVSELMWRDTEEMFPHTKRASDDAAEEQVEPVARVSLALLSVDAIRELERFG